MAGNQSAFQLSGTHRPQAPVNSGVTGGRPAAPTAGPMHPSPVPPRMGLPVDLVRGPYVEISDVSRDLMTVDDMKNELTEYAIFRFEKMPMQNRYDDEGRFQPPTWERAIRAHVPGMLPRETARQIQRLNRDTRPLVDKLKTLSPVLQRQIEAAQEHLTSQNPDRMNYQWVLAQIDHQLREIDSYVAAAGDNHSLHRKHHGSTRKRHHSRTGHRRKSYERISLTAYFKRTPRQHVDISMLYEAKKRLSLSGNDHNAYQSTGNDPRLLRVGPKPLGGGAPVGPNGARGGVPSATARPNEFGPGEGGNFVRNVAVGNRENGEEATRNHNTTRRDLGCSDSSSSDRSFDTQTTRATSMSSGSFNGGNRRRDPGDVLVPTGSGNGKRHENEQGRDSPRRHALHEPHHKPRDEPRLSSNPGQHPPLRKAGVEIDRAARDDGYLAGIRDGRGDARLVQQQRTLQEARHLRPKPRIIQEMRSSTPSYRRHMSHPEPEGFGHRDYLSDEISRLHRLSLDVEDGYDAVLRRADTRRRREFEYLPQRGSVLDDDPFDNSTLSYAREGRRRYRERYITDDSESDSSPPRGDRLFRY
ncbi:hypothetical protein F4818DRAFT_260998 [Hypoxylon cercidicola]|nr:hypothetical protein F4818DRAFT_260998 [Hypoxylon cercidicola]